MAHAYASIDAETKNRKTCLIETSVPKYRQRSDVKIGRAFFFNQEWLGEKVLGMFDVGEYGYRECLLLCKSGAVIRHCTRSV
jgi:hypothetical protein